MKSRKYLFLTLIFVISTMLLSSMLMAGTASQTTKVKVSPPAQDVSLGQSFSVNITVEPHTAIAGAQFNLQFDPSLVQVNSVAEGNLFKQSGFPTFFLSGEIDNTTGVIKGVACNIIGQANVSTPGTFAIINLTAKNTITGTSPLSLIDIPPIYVKVADPNGYSVPISIENGTVRVVSIGGYPSIMGIHTGNFTPFHNLTVNRIYTYPCPGTGGHSEYIAFFDYETDEKIAEANWTGYKDSEDYHYVIFDKNFDLHAGTTYRYQIKTDSYPQIHHTSRLETDEGIITCISFIDANGRIYDDWIPAIRLE